MKYQASFMLKNIKVNNLGADIPVTFGNRAAGFAKTKMAENGDGQFLLADITVVDPVSISKISLDKKDKRTD